MPGPRMGPRPADFDEDVIKQSPTFVKWLSLKPGEKLKYACREFIRDHEDDEERLMRRIMIARRNNIRDHETLKEARKVKEKIIIESTAAPPCVTTTIAISTQAINEVSERSTSRPTKVAPSSSEETMIQSINTTTGTELATSDSERKSCQQQQQQENQESVPVAGNHHHHCTDKQVENEMDVAAVESTRSYHAWMKLKNGMEFIYNQKYVKGREGHDWLLRKNIWRRMRYRRENKKLVQRMKGGLLEPGQIKIAYTSVSNEAEVAATLAINDFNTFGQKDRMNNDQQHPQDMSIDIDLETRGATSGLPKVQDVDNDAVATQAAAAIVAAAAVTTHETMQLFGDADQAAVEAAVAAAVSFGKSQQEDLNKVNVQHDNTMMTMGGKLEQTDSSFANNNDIEMEQNDVSNTSLQVTGDHATFALDSTAQHLAAAVAEAVSSNMYIASAATASTTLSDTNADTTAVAVSALIKEEPDNNDAMLLDAATNAAMDVSSVLHVSSVEPV